MIVMSHGGEQWGLEGRWFWYDEADPPSRQFYAGQFVEDLGDGYLLVRFLPHRLLRPGTQEVTHLQRVAAERWVVFETEEELKGAMQSGVPAG